jgi:hypothetical protein
MPHPDAVSPGEKVPRDTAAIHEGGELELIDSVGLSSYIVKLRSLADP